MGRLADAKDLFVGVAVVAYKEEIRYPAAALAYYGFVSFVPLLILLFAIMGEQGATQLGRQIPQLLTRGAQGLVDRAVTTATARAGAGILAGMVLVWSGINVVGDIRTVLQRIEGTVKQDARYWVRDGAAILGSLVIAVLAIVGTTAMFDFPPFGQLFGLDGLLVLWAALTLAFLPLYYVPSVLITTPRAALPGALTTAFGWTIIHTAVQFYSVHAAQYAIYGVLSGVIIILTSLYFAASVLLIGIIVNALLAAEPYVRET